MEKAIAKVMKKISNKAIINVKSAIFSYLWVRSALFVRRDKNENMLLVVSRIHVTPVNSSIMDTSLYLDIFSEVSTTRQNPNKLPEVFRICWALLFSIEFL